jgi:hypothetical protein
VVSKRISVRRRHGLGRQRRACGVGDPLVPTLNTITNVLLESIPLRLLGVLELLARILVFTAGAPRFAASRRSAGVTLGSRAFFTTGAAHLTVVAWSRPFPTPFAFAAPGVTRRVAGVVQLSPLEPLHHRRRILFLEPIERWQQLVWIVRPESGRLVVDQNSPIRVAGRHAPMIVPSAGCNAQP